MQDETRRGRLRSTLSPVIALGLLGAVGGAILGDPSKTVSVFGKSVPFLQAIAFGLMAAAVQLLSDVNSRWRAYMVGTVSMVGWFGVELFAEFYLFEQEQSEPPHPIKFFVWSGLGTSSIILGLAVANPLARRLAWLCAAVVVGGIAGLAHSIEGISATRAQALQMGTILICLGLLATRMRSGVEEADKTRMQRFRNGAAMITIAAIVAFFLAKFAHDDVYDNIALKLSVFFVPMIFLLFHLMRKANDERATNALADNGDYCLYLRSFKIDKSQGETVKAATIRTLIAASPILLALFFLTARRRLDNMDLQRRLNAAVKNMPVVAIGDKVTRHGVAKIVTSDDDWQAVAMGLIERAKLIVFSPFPTPGATIELELIADRYLEKTIFVQPSIYASGVVDFDARWQALRAAMAPKIMLPEFLKTGRVFRMARGDNDSNGDVVVSHTDNFSNKTLKAAIRSLGAEFPTHGGTKGAIVGH
jgi:hypothetical protein